MMREDRFARIAPLYLWHTARLKCATCGRLAPVPVEVPFLVTPDELRAMRGVTAAGYTTAARRLIVRRAAAHYAEIHPEITLPK